MHLAFIDITYGYDAARPDQETPVGGTTLGICFLAREMVKTGIKCTFFNRVAEACEAYGIPSLPLQALAHEVGDKYDAYIFCGRWTADLVALVRQHTKAPLIGWMHESLLAPPFTPPLADFDAMVFVSAWQQKINQQFAQRHWKQTIIGNGMNPAIAKQFAPQESIRAAKTELPLALYVGHFARGAFHVPAIVERMAAKRSDFSVEIFCNEDPSSDAEANARYIDWMRSRPHIAHVGKVGKQDFVTRLRRASLLLAPNPWPETSCVALIEALASGLSAVITARAVLPETAAGFARQIPIENADDPLRFDMKIDYDAFADAALEVLREFKDKPGETEQRLRRQVDYFVNNYQWSHRTEPWRSFIESLKAG